MQLANGIHVISLLLKEGCTFTAVFTNKNKNKNNNNNTKSTINLVLKWWGLNVVLSNVTSCVIVLYFFPTSLFTEWVCFYAYTEPLGQHAGIFQNCS